MTLRCPKCGEPSPREMVSVASDTARCPCGFTGRFSDLIGADEKARPDRQFFDDLDEPAGAWRARKGDQVIIGALNLSWRGLALLPIGAIGVVLWIHLLSRLIVNTASTRDDIVGLVMATIFIAMTLIPAVFCILGHVEITMTQDAGTIKTSLGRFGFTRRFVPRDVDGISERDVPGRRRQMIGHVLQLHGPSDIRFGAGLCARHRQFIRAAMETELGLVRKDDGPSRKR